MAFFKSVGRKKNFVTFFAHNDIYIYNFLHYLQLRGRYIYAINQNSSFRRKRNEKKLRIQ